MMNWWKGLVYQKEGGGGGGGGGAGKVGVSPSGYCLYNYCPFGLHIP